MVKNSQVHSSFFGWETAETHFSHHPMVSNERKCEQAFELSDASAERSAAGCTIKLNKEQKRDIRGVCDD